ncbi:MAG: hypothetical protein ABI831_11650 [Betaproteobacteria bacterium]
MRDDAKRIVAGPAHSADVRGYIALLVAVQLAIIAVVRPHGDFPINDDWAYGHSVQWLLGEHRIRLSNWIAMNLLPQTLAGGLVAVVFGFSFETLRHLTQAVAALTCIAGFFWFRAARLDPAQATVASIAVVAMPCWPVLANSYMTDLYGLVFALSAATLFLRSLDRPLPRTLLAATLLASIGVLERQVVIVVPFAFMVAWFWASRAWTVRTLVIGVAPLLAAFAAETCYQTYLALGPGIPSAQQYAHARVLPMILKIIKGEEGLRFWAVLNLVSIAGYLGLFTVGWAAWWGMRGATRRAQLAVLGAALVLAAIAIAFGWLPPYRQNQVIDAAGIGPFTLYDGLTHPTAPLDRTPGAIWQIAGAAAACGVAALLALLLVCVAHLFRAGRDAAPDRVFMITVIGAYLGPFVVTDYIDRYLLFVLPFVFALWARTWPANGRPPARLQRGIALAWILVILATSMFATRDYFAWNRARWDAIRIAESLGATPDMLDAGFEYNGFKRFEDKPTMAAPGKSWWWVTDDRYVVAFSPVPGYEEIETIQVQHWLPRSPGAIRLLRRKEPGSE